MANYYPGGQDLVTRLLALKRQSQLTGQVNPDVAGVVQGSLADQRNRTYQDAMLGLQEKGMALKQTVQTAQESQFGQALALKKQEMEDQIAAANRARVLSWINTGVGAGLLGGYLGMKGWGG